MGNNVTARPWVRFLNMTSPVDYFFGTKDFDGVFEQGGMYNSAFCSVRIEELPSATLRALDSFWAHLEDRERTGAVTYNFFNFVRQVEPHRTPVGPSRSRILGLFVHGGSDPPEVVLRAHGRQHGFTSSGSCSNFTSQALVNCGLAHGWSYFPKRCLVDLLEEEHAHAKGNAHVVYYKRVDHAVQHWPNTSVGFCLVSPTQWFRNWYYWDLEPFADIVVSVPPKSTTAEVCHRSDSRRKPLLHGDILHSASIAIGSALLILPRRFKIFSCFTRFHDLGSEWRGLKPWLHQRRGRVALVSAFLGVDMYF